MSNDLQTRTSLLVAIALFCAIGGLILADLVLDYLEGASTSHLLIESGILAGAGGGILLLWRQLNQSRADLARVHDEAARWRNQHQQVLAGLGAAIDQQFRSWHLTNAEAEVGLLLLKGLSHKEVADLRGTSERTIREQARALYRKAGLAGRASLSAFFLEDLLLPASAPGADGESAGSGCS